MEKIRLAEVDERLRSVIATLEGCREVLGISANAEAAQLLGMTILQLRMQLHRIEGPELKALCDAVAAQTGSEAAQPVASAPNVVAGHFPLTRAGKLRI